MPRIGILPGEGIGPEVVVGRMLFGWPGRTHNDPKAAAAAALIDAAVDKSIAGARNLTRDLGGKAGTTEMDDAIVSAM